MNQSNLDTAIQCLNQGNVILTPSESCYGFSCDATNVEAVRKLHYLKREPENKPLTILVSSLDQMESIAHLNAVSRALSSAFHPGPLNLIVMLKNSHYVPVARNETIAFRIPSDPTLLQLAKRFARPITTTSANLHSQPMLYVAKDVRDQFEHDVCIILDTGDLDSSNLPSTIFDTIALKTIRHGQVLQTDLDKRLSQIRPS